ncbi:hypothetical protein MSLAZ_2102 [Methanosarcina lacustris Z-7289]|uniref:Uncharacterized protein n=1 Tax=Methanosarcina lacustris Z-7289 TaxID=1434111 RepID=A0A0E3S8D5_9EURY|nr:hypothetical protein [Methanosarcina lacustris]AKB75363.1 hypothetical protein MSLAZ_2102 [Methanosarcina lacustris Z-7289]
MNSLKELRENGLKGLKMSGLKDLILKPKTADENIEDMENLAKSREQVKRKIINLIKEKKEIEARIDLIQKSDNNKSEDLIQKSDNNKSEGVTEFSELPWREEIFPPLPRKVHVKMSGALEVKNDSLNTGNPGLSEVKVSGMDIEVKGIHENSADKTPERRRSEGKISEYIIPDTSQNILVNDAEGAAPKSGAGEINGSKAFPGNVEQIKTVDLFSIEKVNENKVSSGNSSESPIEKSKPESKNNPAAGLFGDSLIDELLNSDDLNPEEEQGFMKYLGEQEAGELITDLNNVKALLTRTEHAG